MAVNIALSVAVFAFNMIRSWRGRRVAEADNPWQAQTLEWVCTSPPPIENFEHIPTVTGLPYRYGQGPVPLAEPLPAAGRPQP